VRKRLGPRIAAVAALAAVASVAVGCGSGASRAASGVGGGGGGTGIGGVGMRITRGVVYGTGAVGAPARGRVPLLLDVYTPGGRSAAARPAVVLIHGGGWTAQSRLDDGIVRVARGLAAEGVVAASIDYRLIPQAPVPSPRVAPLGLPAGQAAAVDDTLTAIAYLRAHAPDLGIDPDRMGVAGSSAGAVTADDVAYALDDHGIRPPRLRFAGSLWGGIFAPSPTPGADPATQLDAGEPALFAVHGDADPTVPVALDDALVARAEAEGVRVEYQRIPGGGHGYHGSGFFTVPARPAGTPFTRFLAFARSALR
jgi:acetyl esterase/lipase